ncbi:FHA domain [Babesia ovis]|uniref:FHA domain n=1 Tax=Babesia ovis TaxID=5869 RepID=A0A9W5WV14_BABOV|nr:FHA domain [Babesia ovis]
MEPINTAAKTKPLEIVARLLMYQAGPTELLDFEKCAYAEDTLKIKPSEHEDDSASDTTEENKCTYIVQNGRKLHVIAYRHVLMGYLERYPFAMVLAKLIWSDKGCYLCSPDVERSQEVPYDCYRVINSHLYRRAFGCRASSRRVAYALKEGDRILLGRATLLVRHLARKPANSLSHIHAFMSSEGQDAMAATTTQNEIEQQTDDCVKYAVRNTGSCVRGSSTVSTTVEQDKADTSTSLCDVDDIKPAENDMKIDEGGTNQTASANVENEIKCCRICLEDETSGPLVVPCKCKGSMKYVHLACVRTWVQGRLKIRDDEGRMHRTYFLQNLTCELCNVPYPPYVDVQSVWTEFLGIEEPSPPYAVLEPEHSAHAGLHIASLSTTPVNIGRSGDSGIILQDISVSRVHATMHYCEGEFVIEDRNSKFGTILHIGSDFRIPVERGEPIAIKIGTDVLCIEAKPERMSLRSLCCFGYNPNTVRVVV